MNGMKHLKFWKHSNNYISNSKFPALDQTTPWYNFNLYVESCNSLGFKPSVTSFVRYNAYYKELFAEK